MPMDPNPKASVESDPDPLRVKRKTLEAVLLQCQRALELINATSSTAADVDEEDSEVEGEATASADPDADELCDLLKSRVECPAFLQQLECAQASVSQNIDEEGNSWDMVSKNDLWEGERADSEQEDYVLVRQEDIVEGIACFMAAYLLSLKQTKVCDMYALVVQLALYCPMLTGPFAFLFLIIPPNMLLHQGANSNWGKCFDLTPIQLQSGYIKTLLFSGLQLKHSGLHVMLYQSFSDLPVQLAACSKVVM
ncbi:hypothetical protein JHK85_009757 [Glycine max]|nr:hypothetical protein JHK85_009757 [Glycine max]